MMIGNDSGSTSAANYLNSGNKSLLQSILALASGSRLADPSTDAAGLAVSGDLQARLDRLQAAGNNVNDTVSAAQTTDGFLSTIQDQLTRLGTLAQSATNGALGSAASSDYSAEFNNLLGQINQVAASAGFAGTPLFTNGSISTTVDGDGSTASFQLSSLGSATSLGLNGLSVSTPAAALQALGQINTALTQVTNRRAQVNADVSAFGFYATNIGTQALNTAAANSRITDLDVAKESTRQAQSKIQTDAATSVLAQANSDRRYVLALLS